jgi:hypothetical protein
MVMVPCVASPPSRLSPTGIPCTGNATLKPPPRRAEKAYVGKLALGASTHASAFPGVSHSLGKGCCTLPASKDCR